MERLIGRYSDVLFAIMRLVIGALFACHGAQKLFGAFGGQVMTSIPLMFVAGIIELVGGILIAVGLWTGYAAFVASGEMAVAYFRVHAPGGFWPIVNQGELAVLYCFLFLYLASHGPGKLSLEALIRKPKQD
jgi:putative oxidoreductase